MKTRRRFYSKSGTPLPEPTPRSLEYSAHTLKGAVGNFGAQRAWECALRLEMMGRGGEMSDAESAVNELEREVRGLMEALAGIAVNEQPAAEASAV